VQEVQRKGGRVLGIVNVVGSSIARTVDGGIYIHAGPEVSVASTKTFTCTLVAFALLALHLGRIRDLSPAAGRRLIDALQKLPDQMREILRNSGQVRALARKYAQRTNAFFIGRANSYPVALEGAQKLKEIAYLHAEAYPASELKHGPLALICPETPTVVVVPRDHLYEKSISSLEEVRARRGPVICVTHAGDERLPGKVDDIITVPPSEYELNPVLMTLPLQLFAYYAALELGRDIDQPRNLAKSVTVE
jgi:glutamine---fructose-6-phosphate transaminase (isomerizing)